VGESIRVGGYQFIVGSEGEEGNRFRDLIADLDIECYVINTGAVGTDDPIDVGVEETVAVLEGAARNRIEWGVQRRSGVDRPEQCPGHRHRAVLRCRSRRRLRGGPDALRDDRRDYLDRFADLDDEIRNAMY